MTGRNFYNWRWIIDPTWLSAGERRTWPHAELRSDRAKGKPDASVFGGYERPDFGFSQRASMQREILHRYARLSTTLFSASISTWPVFNRNQGALVADTAAIQAARSRIAAVNLSLRHEVAQNLVRFDGAGARVAAYRSGVRDQAAHNLDCRPPDLQLRSHYLVGCHRGTAPLHRYRDWIHGHIARRVFGAHCTRHRQLATNLP